MLSPSAALQTALYQLFSSDTALQNLLQSGGIHDHHPRGATFPYLVLGQGRIRDWSTSTEPGAQHELTLHIWSDQKARSKIQAINHRISELIETAAPSLTDHLLVNLAVTSSEIGNDGRNNHLHGQVRLRAITEPVVA